MTPRLRAESDGAMVKFEGMRREELDTLDSCVGRPMSNEFSFRLIEQEKISWHPSRDSVDSCFKARYVLCEIRGRKRNEELSVISVEIMFGRWIWDKRAATDQWSLTCITILVINRTEPWGTPWGRRRWWKTIKIDNKIAQREIDWSQERTVPFRPNQEDRRWTGMEWSMVSKAGDRSRRQRAVILCWLMALMMWLWTEISVDSVEWCLV